MKSIYSTFLVLTAFLIPMNLQASGDASDAILSSQNFVDLTLKKSAETINLSYPGLKGKRCGIELRFSRFHGLQDGIPNFVRTVRLEEENPDGEEQWQRLTPKFIKNERENTYRLIFRVSRTQHYMTRIRISTESGRALEKVIRDAFRDSDEPDVRQVNVIAMASDC